MEGKGKILEVLQKLCYLLDEEKEWGGRVNLHTGEIEELREGEGVSFKFSPRKEREKGPEGWRGFHAHPAAKSPLPSVEDFLAVHLCGAEGYIITAVGIWEITPLKVCPLEQVIDLLKSSAKLLAPKTLEAYRVWEDHVKALFPVGAKLFKWSE